MFANAENAHACVNRNLCHRLNGIRRIPASYGTRLGPSQGSISLRGAGRGKRDEEFESYFGRSDSDWKNETELESGVRVGVG